MTHIYHATRNDKNGDELDRSSDYSGKLYFFDTLRLMFDEAGTDETIVLHKRKDFVHE